MDCEYQSVDEIEALSSIYGDEWKRENETGTSYSIQVTPDVTLFVTFTPEYPSKAPPTYELLAPCLTLAQKRNIADEFGAIFLDNLGCPVLFQWIERLKELVRSDERIIEDCGDVSAKTEAKETQKRTFTNVIHGPTIQDRKSVFQGHACSITSDSQVKEFIEHLLENKKIAQAKHNIYAYRLRLPNGVVLQDCDDDGENHAGGRLLHLLQIVDVMNCIVVVTRWYGGIHLGPDRFKHINNAARRVMLEAGFIKT